MKRCMTGLAGALLGLLEARSAYSQETPSRTFGTALPWEESVENAVARAREEGRLVLLLHISGNFEDADLT